MAKATADILDRNAVDAAYERIRAHVRETPVVKLAAADGPGDRPVALKLEQTQHTGSFKARGAFNAMLAEPVPAAGVIAASGGNHGAAVAYAARALGHRAEIFVPEIADPSKVARLERYGAALHVTGEDFAAALTACETRRQETGARLLHAYDQADIVAGQGTVGRELAAQAPEIDTLLVAVGGGGLIGGIACWYRGDVRLVAVETEGTASLHTARREGRACDIQVSGVAADSLGAPCRRDRLRGGDAVRLGQRGGAGRRRRPRPRLAVGAAQAGRRARRRRRPGRLAGGRLLPGARRAGGGPGLRRQLRSRQRAGRVTRPLRCCIAA